MGRRDFQSTVADTLPRIIKEQTKAGIGSIKFTKRDKKLIGKIYVRAGAIYAIDLSTYSPNIVSRIVTNEFITDKNREQIVNKFANNLQDTGVVDFVLKYQLFPEKPLMTYIKDYFFDAFDELYQWTEVNAEWRSNDEPPNTVLRVPNVNPEDVIDKLVGRQKYLEQTIAPDWNVHPKEMLNVQYWMPFEYEEPDYTRFLLTSIVKDTPLTIGYASEYLGLSKFNTKVSVHSLWESGIVDIVHPSGLKYSNRSEENINKPSTHNNPMEEELTVVTTQPLVGMLATEIAPEPIVYLQPITVPPEAQTPAVSSYDIPAIVPETYAPLHGVEQYISPVYEEYVPINYETPPPEIYTSPTPITTQQEQQYPEIATTTNIIKENKMTDPSHTSASTRLKAIADQLRRELAGLQNSITDAQRVVDSKEQYVRTLHDERALLVNKLKDLDGRIATETNTINAAKQELLKLQQEYNESRSLLS